jgi:hypothetical protein
VELEVSLSSSPETTIDLQPETNLTEEQQDKLALASKMNNLNTENV